ncbi:bpX6 domain-containing protein [Massilia sp. CF038]|uniref:bpX6 domain-containing protein n=1 Tax=Massilia sp. CF038 TaxID=1881045 RepID=UPI000918A7DA|nr:bpX6 domain-containing protein [Massilia sp. CF038]SHH13798.1 hypothetical protein SAMN05428948_2973 [Massilia sp. CF038]
MNNIRRPLFDGMREIHAIWFDVPLIGEPAARRRILAHWQRGARLHRAAEGYLLTLAQSRFADCDGLDGLALCRLGTGLSSAPLAVDELAAIPPGGCLLVRGAHAVACSLTAAELVDPALWIDTSAIAIREPMRIPRSKVKVSMADPEAEKSLREILDNAILPPSEAREQFLRERARAAKEGTKGGTGVAGKAVGMALIAAAAGAGLLATMLIGLLGASKTGGGGSGSSGGGSGGKASAEATGRRAPDPIWKQKLFAAAAKLAVMSKISDVIGWRQAAYLRKMVDMFEQGDIAEALRHAIPLGGDDDNMRQLLGSFGPRSSLEINAPGGTSATVNVDMAMQQYLREKYRHLFARLDRDGRIDEATFVLAELLKSPMEAVDYLEKNKRFKQAAQLAEKLQLSAEVSLRLWFLAGDIERAVRIARLTGSFADAVRKLELSQHSGAAELRMAWASYLAARGDLAEAADALWPLEAQHEQALAWLLQAERNGGMPGARALARKLALMPEALADSVGSIRAILDAPEDSGARLRVTLCTELCELNKQSSATRRLAAELLRPLLAERSVGLNQLDRTTLKRLITVADAGTLQSDLPPIDFKAPATPVTLNNQTAPLQLHGGDVGLLAIYDARRLPCGQYLLALGEGGMLRVTAKGKHVVHFPLPAFQLVLSKNGQRALALARRGDVVRVSRVDLVTCKVSDWITHPIDFWAGQYDGVVWNAVIDNRVVAIDTTQDHLALVWQIADLPGRVVAFHDTGASQTILIGTDSALEQWRYQLPDRRLIQRDSFSLPVDGQLALAHPACSTPLVLRLDQNDGVGTLHVPRLRGGDLEIQVPVAAETSVDTKASWLMVQSVDSDGQFRCMVVDRQLHAVVAQLNLAHAEHAGVAAHDDHILLFDRAGRLLDLDTTDCKVHSLSIS